MKRIILTAAIIIAFLGANAQNPQDTTWKYNGVFGINLSQVSLSNWASGGEGSVAFDVLMNYDINYDYKKTMWHNRIELAYGMNKLDNSGTKKTNDKIYISSNYGYKVSNTLYISANGTFNTQFANGYNYPKTDASKPISMFMAPAYLSVGTGITWIPKKWFTAVVSPITWRGVFVNDKELSDMGAFGVEKGKKFKSELGANVKLEVKQEIMSNIKLYSRLELFSNYLDKPQNVDVAWDVQISMQINKWVSANLSTNLLYDDNTKSFDKDGKMTGPKVQFKEVLGVGVQIQF